jgi:hypothetical protein
MYMDNLTSDGDNYNPDSTRRND